MLTQPNEPVPHNVSFIPVVSLRQNLEALARDLGFAIQHGQDD